MKAYPEKMEANTEETKLIVEHQEVPKEEAAVEDRYGDWHPKVWRCQQPKKRTRGDGGSWKKLAAALR
jgi:hypothetical protein